MSKNQPFTHILVDKKTQSRIRLEPGSAAPLARAEATPISVGTKLSSNLQSQNVRRTHSKLEESRFQRDYQNNSGMVVGQLLSREILREFSIRASN
jgi:hypothetical protein